MEYNGATHRDAEASALAWVLENYDTGVALIKTNSDGSFKKIKTNEEVINGSSEYTIHSWIVLPARLLERSIFGMIKSLARAEWILLPGKISR